MILFLVGAGVATHTTTSSTSPCSWVTWVAVLPARSKAGRRMPVCQTALPCQLCSAPLSCYVKDVCLGNGLSQLHRSSPYLIFLANADRPFVHCISQPLFVCFLVLLVFKILLRDSFILLLHRGLVLFLLDPIDELPVVLERDSSVVRRLGW